MKTKVLMAIAVIGLMLGMCFGGCISKQEGAVPGPDDGTGAEVTKGNNFFFGADNASIYYQFWKVENPIAVMIIVHGYGEHCERYDWVARNFYNHSISCYALDHRGHGRSTGLRCNVENYTYYIEDLQTFVKLVKSIEGPEKKYFMLGHSMGGGIAVVYSEIYAAEMNAFIYSAPSVGFAGAPMAAFQAAAAAAPVVEGASPLLSDYETPYVIAQSKDLNHDENNTRAYDEDPLVYHGGLKARMGAQLLDLIAYACDNVGDVSKPCIFLQGSDDKLVDKNATKDFYDNVSIEDKKYILYEGFYHETLNEPEWLDGGKVRVMNDIYEWLLPRI